MRSLALVLLTLLPSCRTSEVSAFQEPKKLALLVGIDKYEKVSDLDGCVNDVENMKSLLRDKFGFEESNIRVLVNEQATRQAILDAFQRHLVAQAQAGDIVVFHYSGHGSQMKDAEGGDEPDRFDETLVPTDSRKPNVYDIPDDSINALLQLLSEKTENITFLLDSCHSGTAARAAGKVRTVEKDERTPPPPDAFTAGVRGTAEGEDAFRPSEAKYVLLSGSASNQLSNEYFADGQTNGAFTYFFAKEVRAAMGKVTYQDVLDKVAVNVTARFSAQEPQIEGAARNNYLFSDETSLAENHVLTDPVGQDRVALRAGSIQGLTTGSLYEVYAPGTKTFSPPAQPVAKVELTRVDGFRAEGKVLSGGPVSGSSRAVERRHRYPDRKLVVHYSNLVESETLRKVKEQLAAEALITEAAEPRGYQLLLTEREGHIATEGADPVEISPRVPVSASDAVERVARQVEHWARWFKVLDIENQTPALDIGVRVDRESGEFTVGEEFEVTVENKTDKDLFLSVLDLSTDGSISIVFPDAPGAREILAKRGTWTRKLRTTLPDGRDEVKDILKVYVATEPVDLSSLALGGVRGVERAEPESWVTKEAVIRVRR